MKAEQSVISRLTRQTPNSKLSSWLKRSQFEPYILQFLTANGKYVVAVSVHDAMKTYGGVEV
jgi:hypothetical protein